MQKFVQASSKPGMDRRKTIDRKHNDLPVRLDIEYGG